MPREKRKTNPGFLIFSIVAAAVISCGSLFWFWGKITRHMNDGERWSAATPEDAPNDGARIEIMAAVVRHAAEGTTGWFIGLPNDADPTLELITQLKDAGVRPLSSSNSTKPAGSFNVIRIQRAWMERKGEMKLKVLRQKAPAVAPDRLVYSMQEKEGRWAVASVLRE